MAEILKEWLSERLNQPITWESEDFVTLMRDGTILARLLLSYKVINDEQRCIIRPAISETDIKNNWTSLTTWLKNMEIHLTETEVVQIHDGRGSALLRLFYQLFLHLDKKDRTDFIKRERKLVSNLVSKVGNRFNVEKIDEKVIPVIDYLAKPLADEKYFIEWQRDKSDQLKRTYDLIGSQFRKTCDKIEQSRIPVKREHVEKPFKFTKEKQDIDKFEKSHPCKFENYTYDQLLDMDERVNKYKEDQNILNEEWAKNYISHLQSKHTNIKATRAFQKQMRKVISSSMWEHTIGEEEDNFDKELANKVMKLSHFEKQMCTQLIETKQQARNLSKNRMDAEKEYAAQKEQQFGQYLDDLKHQMHADLVEIDFEKMRQNDLHNRLYAEKIKRKRQHYYDICYDTMLSMVDYAVKFAYFKILAESDVPTYYIHEWKALYFKHQPVFDTIETVEDILTVDTVEDPTEIEAVVHLEIERQDCQNENDFLDYHNALGPWEVSQLIPNYDPDCEKKQNEYLGLRVLGHVVYKLLETKYPYPSVQLPADLPKFTSKAILRCLPDRSITVPMQVLLSGSKLNVIRVESAVNYCLKTFKTEMVGCTNINLAFDKFIAYATESNQDLLMLMKSENEKFGSNISQIGVIPMNIKQTQTPKTIPEEEIVLSTAADLGRYAYELLCGGEALTDYLISAIIVEYLKTFDKINGFVLINYPNSYTQAQILEDTFLGRGPPDVEYLDNEDDVYLEQCALKMNPKTKDIFEDVRYSKLVPDPHSKKEIPPFVSYFTAYIHLKESSNILAEDFIWNLNEQNSEVIDRYYANQYVNYSIYYEIIDKNVLALICKYIIGDFALPLKEFDLLFGPGILSTLDFPSSDEKRQKSKILKQETSKLNALKKIKNASKSSRLAVISKEAELTTEASILVEEEIPPEMEELPIMEEEIEISKPGDEKWLYGDLPLVEDFGVLMASVWEQAERAYINDLEHLFFAIRLELNNVVPYSRFVRDKVEQIIRRPNEKQEVVTQFQRQYNDYEDDWRFINVTKIEWHCRIKELQKALYAICDMRKKDSLSERERLIFENWSMEELTGMANIYISCMQSELNRATLTYQLLHDFYFSMLTRPPVTDRLTSKDLSRIVRDSEDSQHGKRPTDDKIFAKLRSSYQEFHMKNITIDQSNNPYNQLLENNMKNAQKLVKELNVKYQAIIVKETGDVSKISSTKNKKTEADVGSPEQLGEEYLKLNMLKCLEEWKVAIDGEMHRTNFRLEMLLGRAYIDFKLFNDFMTRTFLEVEEQINKYYLREIQAVDELCECFQMAVERSERIKPSLILEEDRFYVDPNLEQFPSPPPTPEPQVTERPGEGEFRVGQLARLREHLKLVAPTGIVLEPNFIYLLQDFLLYGKESCDGPLVPATWRALEPEQIPELVSRLFGQATYVDWRDFLVYCLGVRFPSVDELLELQKELRCADEDNQELIGRGDFVKLTLWFEADMDTEEPSVQLRLCLIKHFLFELYETAPDEMNYSAFLLALCKASDPRVGFAKALSLSLGNRVCYGLEECESTILKLIELKEYKDACRACALECAEQFKNILLDRVIQFCEGTTISEILITASELELASQKTKGKQSKLSPKGKLSREKSSIKHPQTSKQKVANKVTPTEKKEIPRNEIPESPKEIEDDRIVEPVSETSRSMEGEADQEPEVAPVVTYSVSPQVIRNILETCLPWHFKPEPVEKERAYQEKITEILERLGMETDTGDVYVAKFLNEEVVCKILHKVRKFEEFTLMDVARSLLKLKPSFSS